jgi:hypothetical protein
VRKRLADLGLSASGASSDVLRKFMAAEQVKYEAVVKAAHITAE